MKRLFRLFALVSLLITLFACGGGGGGSGRPIVPSGDGTSEKPPGAPTLALSPQSIKNFQFSWDDVDGETEYRLLENADGNSGYDQVATITADATSYNLNAFLPGRTNASYILQACNSTCTDSEPVHVGDDIAALAGYFKASTTATGFGYSVALSAAGNTLAVGARGESSNAIGINGDPTDNSAPSSGAVYVFTRTGGEWAQQAYVKTLNTEERDMFGTSIALSNGGSVLAVGARGESSNAVGINGDHANNLAEESGAVYVYARDGESWSLVAYVKATNTDGFDGFGSSVALAGDGRSLAVGAYEETSSATALARPRSKFDIPSHEPFPTGYGHLP
ncbi:hypothetical protein ACXYTJ_07980 [Gilvimarinus sp. F26214L]|uniref:hypothetical protein n=1 Tax=Gilvimarinus sp. DZF01 TaxID=3461371 RepID=UPI00404610BD